MNGMRVGGAVFAGFLMFAAVAGCGSVPGVFSVPGSATTASPRTRAEADAASILASFVPPAGARRLGDATVAVLRQPPRLPSTPNLVDDSAFWRAPGQPQGVLAWSAAHLPRGFSRSGIGQISSGGEITSQGEEFSRPPVPGVLAERDLLITTAPAGPGQTEIRVDAQVQWLPAKLASERVPAAATAVRIGVRQGLAEPGMRLRFHPPVTVTNPAAVRRIADLVDGLRVFPPGTYHCPADFGWSVTLTFLAGAHGRTLVVATAGLSGCGGVAMQVTGARQGPGLAGGPGLVSGALSAAGLRWAGFMSR